MSTTATVKRPIMRYHGGKFRLAPWIISHLPAHRVYVEPYGGAGSVLLRKPRSYAEIYNDLDGEIVNVFRVLRDVEMAAKLKEQIRLTPFARSEFVDAYLDCEDPLERARRTLVKSFMGFGSAAVTQQSGDNSKTTTGFRNNSNRSGTTPAHDWANLPKHVDLWVERLAGIVVESRPALGLIDLFDTPETLFYVDPPYVHSTRGDGKGKSVCRYRHEMTDDDHRELAEHLHSIKGIAVVSGYPSVLYDTLYAGWKTVFKDTHADKALDRTECLWLNPAATRSITPAMDFGDAA